MFKRPSDRQYNQMREITLESQVSPYAEGSCLAKFGNTHVFCTASVDTKLPPWLRNSGKGWITAEYGMLPRSTHSRMDREVSKGKPSGRTQEIQRLIGRSLRSIVDLKKLGDHQIKIDCDVIQADGGTRCASITGGWIALRLAVNKLLNARDIKEDPLTDHVSAISCGIYAGQPILDLDYAEDSEAGTDANFVMTGSGKIIELQGSAEGATFSRAEFNKLMDLAEQGTAELITMQKKATT